MPKKARTAFVYTCDRCDKEVASLQDGLVVRGGLFAPTDTQRPLFGHNAESDDAARDEHVRCWSCFRDVAPDPKIAELGRMCTDLGQKLTALRAALAEAPRAVHSARADSETARHQPRVETGPRGEYVAPVSADPVPVSLGPMDRTFVGPLPPPDLPHAIRVARQLAGVDEA